MKPVRRQFTSSRNPSLVVLVGILTLVFLLAGCEKQPEDNGEAAADDQLIPHVRVVAEGLVNPVGMALLPDGGLLVAEEGTGERDSSAGVSLITPDGRVGRVISGLPSGRDAGDLSGVPLVALSPDGQTLYLAHFQFSEGHLWTLALGQEGPLSLETVPRTTDDLTPTMLPSGNVYLTNPFDMTFDPVGMPVVSDASNNGVAKETADGRTRFFHRFDRLTDPANEALQIDAVPTGIDHLGDEYLVTLTGGCPYPADSGLLVAIDEQRNQRTLVSELNMPIDVAVGPDGTIWLLEFARFEPGASCFTGTGYLPGTGRLSRLTEGGDLETVLPQLDYPGAVLPLADGSLYVTEIFAGRVIHIVFAPEDEPPLTKEPAIPVERLPWSLRDVAADAGLDFVHGSFRTAVSADPVAMMGGGLCWIDYDNDGWLDLYLVNSHALDEEDYWQDRGGLPRNALYRNDAGHFIDISAASGTDLAVRGNGCFAADFNMDGWTDIYVTADGPNALLWNNGDGSFDEGAAAAGVDALDWNSAAVVGDLNGDSWPDLFVASYIDLENKIPRPSGAFPQDYYGLPDYLYLNNGPEADGGRVSFRAVADEAGLAWEERGLGALLTDLNSDGGIELYIANDGHPNRLYEIERDESSLGFSLIDITRVAGVGDSGSGMGIAGSDYDGDGLFDLFVTNWDTELNALYRNQTAGEEGLNFRYNTFNIGLAGLGNNLTGWGTAWVDFDHDTDLDLIVVNGHVPMNDLAADAELVRLYGNQLAEGEPGQFDDWTEAIGLEALGPLNARGSALADFDNDGDMDLAINNIGGAAVLLQNDGFTQNWLQIALEGFYPGASVTVVLPDGRELIRQWQVGSSYLASEDPRLHFGLGPATRVDKVVVRLPDGRVLEEENVPANQLLLMSPEL
jgi:hypothetical protein